MILTDQLTPYLVPRQLRVIRVFEPLESHPTIFVIVEVRLSRLPKDFFPRSIQSLGGGVEFFDEMLWQIGTDMGHVDLQSR